MNLTDAELANLTAELHAGMLRIAKVVDGSTNIEYVLADSVPWENYAAVTDPATGMIAAASAMERFEFLVQSTRFRAYEVSSVTSAALAYAYSKNNRRELAFLMRLAEHVGLRIAVDNVCDAKPIKRSGLDPSTFAAVRAACVALLESRREIRPALLHQLIRFATSAQAAMTTMRSSTSPVLFVANDHSPAPVAYAAVARSLGFAVIYLQHAEVTDIFPPLEFELSVLRNVKSKRTYARIGGSQGRVVVANRDFSRWMSPDEIILRQAEIIAANRNDVVIYPSSVVDLGYFESLVATLQENHSVDSVAVQPHPNSRVDLTRSSGGALVAREPVAREPHVAICGNSSVVAELLGQGNVVLVDEHLDSLQPDYYGFVADGLAHAVGQESYGGRFWADLAVIDKDACATLAEVLPNILTIENLLAWVAVEPMLMQACSPLSFDEHRLRDAWRRHGFYRDLIRTPQTLLDSGSWRYRNDGDWMLEALRLLPPESLELLDGRVQIDTLQGHTLLEAALILWRSEITGSAMTNAQHQALRQLTRADGGMGEGCTTIRDLLDRRQTQF